MDDDNSYSLIYWDVNLPKVLRANNDFNGAKMAGRIDLFMYFRSTDEQIYAYLIEKAEKEKVKIFFLTRDGLFKKSSGCRKYSKEMRRLVELIVLQDYRDIVPETAAVESLPKNELIDIIIRVLNHVLCSKQSSPAMMF